MHTIINAYQIHNCWTLLCSLFLLSWSIHRSIYIWNTTTGQPLRPGERDLAPLPSIYINKYWCTGQGVYPYTCAAQVAPWKKLGGSENVPEKNPFLGRQWRKIELWRGGGAVACAIFSVLSWGWDRRHCWCNNTGITWERPVQNLYLITLVFTVKKFARHFTCNKGLVFVVTRDAIPTLADREPEPLKPTKGSKSFKMTTESDVFARSSTFPPSPEK